MRLSAVLKDQLLRRSPKEGSDAFAGTPPNYEGLIGPEVSSGLCRNPLLPVKFCKLQYLTCCRYLEQGSWCCLPVSVGGLKLKQSRRRTKLGPTNSSGTNSQDGNPDENNLVQVSNVSGFWLQNHTFNGSLHQKSQTLHTWTLSGHSFFLGRYEKTQRHQSQCLLLGVMEEDR